MIAHEPQLLNQTDHDDITLEDENTRSINDASIARSNATNSYGALQNHNSP